jgi:hypothetical protein
LGLVTVAITAMATGRRGRAGGLDKHFSHRRTELRKEVAPKAMTAYQPRAAK